MATDLSATGLKTFRQVTFAFLSTGTMVVCLKHVGITDSIRERLKISVKTPTSWSAHDPSTRPGNPSVNVDLFKGLAHIGYGAAGSLMHASVLLASKRA
jgi:hypothetical protein